MARLAGADTAFPVTRALIDSATKVLGGKPLFWGRYFSTPQTGGTVEYRHALEDGVLSAAGIRVLPIARQTNAVGGTAAAGFADGSQNAADLVATFGVELLSSLPGVNVFLDVEGSDASHLSSDYYGGWVAGLKTAPAGVRLRPCVYGIPGDSKTWTALARAVANGVPCFGLWLAHPFQAAPEPVEWSSAAVKPSPDPGVPVLMWQYMFPRDSASLDRSLVNPGIDAQNQLLKFLILPPAQAAPANVA